MEKFSNIKRGQIYYADLSPVIGSEQGGVRPVLILQNDVGNKHSPTTIIAPITKAHKKSGLPTHCFISKECGLVCDSIIELEQIRTIDKCRLLKYVGTVAKEDIAEIEKCLKVSFGITTEEGGK